MSRSPRTAKLRRYVPTAVALAVLVAAAVLVVSGISDIYAPAGRIAAGLLLLAALTFNTDSSRRPTWPR